MNLSEMVTLFYDKIQETSSNSSFSEEKIKRWINEGYGFILDFNDWNFLLTCYSQHLVCTTCSSGGISTGTTLYVDDISGMQKGMCLWVFSGSIFERVNIESIDSDSNIIILKSPGLANSFTEGDYVSGEGIFLPYDCKKILEVKAELITEDQQKAKVLMGVDPRDFDILVPYKKKSAMPTHYTITGIETAVEGKTEDYTMDQGSNTNSVYDSSLEGQEDDYYKGWRLINRTQKDDSLITSYDCDSKLLGLEKAITGQTVGDYYYVVRELPSLSLYPIPDEGYRITIRYYRQPGDLSEDYDTPFLGIRGQNYHSLLVDYALAEAYLADKNRELAISYRQKFFDTLSRFKIEENTPTDGVFNMKPTGMDSLPGFYL